MAVTESQVQALELERVLSRVRTVFERDDKFYAHIRKRNVEKISNRQMRIPLELRPGGAFHYFNPDGGDLGRGGGPTYDKAVVTAVFLVEAMEYTKLTEWSTDDSRKSVVNAVRRMTATALDEIRRQIDAQLMQPGTGVVGTISGVSSAGGVDSYQLNSDGFGARLVRYGQTVQVFDTTLATLKGSGVISMHDTEGKAIDVTPAIPGVIATDVLVTNGLSNPASLPALYGVPYHHSNAAAGTWLGFPRATTPEIRSNRINANGNPLVLPLARLAMNKVGNRLGMDHTFRPTAWTHPAQAAAYEELGQLMMSITKTSKSEPLNLYFGENMQLAGARLETHFNWNPKRIDFIVDDLWGRAEILPIGFYTTDGRKIFEIRGASGGVATADIFYMVVGMQTFVLNPAGTAYIDNLAVPTGY